MPHGTDCRVYLTYFDLLDNDAHRGEAWGDWSWPCDRATFRAACFVFFFDSGRALELWPEERMAEPSAFIESCSASQVRRN